MIQKYVTQNEQEKPKYKVRVFLRSKSNPALRVTKQEGGIETEAVAVKREAQLRKERERELLDLESRGVIFSSLVSSWDEHFQKMKVVTGERSKITHDDYRNGVAKWFKEYWNRPTTDINPYVVTRIFEAMKNKGLCYGHRKKMRQVLKSIFDFGIQSGMLAVARSPREIAESCGIEGRCIAT